MLVSYKTSSSHACHWLDISTTCLSLTRHQHHMLVSDKTSAPHACLWQDIRSTCLSLTRRKHSELSRGFRCNTLTLTVQTTAWHVMWWWRWIRWARQQAASTPTTQPSPLRSAAWHRRVVELQEALFSPSLDRALGGSWITRLSLCMPAELAVKVCCQLQLNTQKLTKSISFSETIWNIQRFSR